MYDKRIKIFIIISALLLAVCLLRLTQMQLLPGSSVQDDIAELKRGLSLQLKTVRGNIFDRTGRRVLAADEPRFWVHINYRFSCFLDERVQQGKLLRAAQKTSPQLALSETREEIRARLEDLQQVINKCAQFKSVEPSNITDEIQKINDFVWDRRVFQAWRRNFPNSEVLDNYDSRISVPISRAIADFEKQQPDPDKRLGLVNEVDIAEMHKDWPLLELKTDNDVFAAQLEFLNIDGVQILPKQQRNYPFGTAAAQTIGWVGPATQEQDKKLFANDRLLSYLGGELCGREDGVEYVCEAILRGRRGELVRDIDLRIISRTETRFGEDVSLTLDIELQKTIENYLTHYRHDPNCGPGMAAVVVDAATGDILALVSMPAFDLNRARYDYGALVNDPNKPLINRAINKRYPPGSVVKPLILIAGLESGDVTPDEIINCPAQKAPKGWPNCLIYNRHRQGHDGRWQFDGGNSTHNAIKGSCNIYFSRLADRIDPLVLQQWLFKFGYGRNILFPPASIAKTEFNRNLRQLPGVISNTIPRGAISNFEQIPPLRESERRWFGIGQGNLRVTPLQVANAMAAIARGGFYMSPRLFLEGPQEPASIENRESAARRPSESIYLNISPQTLDVIYDGMSAVVNEPGGTAYTEFAPVLAVLARQGTKVYGKTGSTEAPKNAWFAGFATDDSGRSISIAVVVEGGEYGSRDAAPLARDIIQFCIDTGYIGQALNAQGM